MPLRGGRPTGVEQEGQEPEDERPVLLRHATPSPQPENAPRKQKRAQPPREHHRLENAQVREADRKKPEVEEDERQPQDQAGTPDPRCRPESAERGSP